MKYKGIELKDIADTPQLVNPPRDMLVWDDGDTEPTKERVFAVVASTLKDCRVIVERNNSCLRYSHCAEIPEEPKPRRATWKQLAYWLMDGKGLVVDDYTSRVDTGVFFNRIDLDEEVSENLKVMRRDDTDWHEPTLEYMELEA